MINIFPPCLEFYTEIHIPANSGAATRGPVVFYRPKYRNDKGIHEHEYCHVRLWWLLAILAAAIIALWSPLYAPLGMAVPPVLYAFVRTYRSWAEVTAYREQLRHQPALGDPERYAALFAEFLANNYDLKISSAEALRKLKG